MAGFVQRPVAAAAALDPELAQYAVWTDTFGLDSAHDYDPVWATCRELGIAPAFHSAAMGWQNRASVSSYVYNHVGMLGESHHALAKSLFLGGVTRRFPDLNFGFLEGGVAWAASLYADLVGHWEKRNVAAMRRLDPERVDWEEFADLFARYGGEWAALAPRPPHYPTQDLDLLDEFAACGIEQAEDIRELFAVPFFCGCEADDPMTTTAFNTRANPFGARFNAMFGSDISHWDVPVMADVLGRGLRDGRARSDHRRRPPRLRVHQPGALLHPRQSGVLCRYGRRVRGRRVPRRSLRPHVLDLVIRRGTVVDGTGAPARRADVGVRDGRIVAIGTVDRTGGRGASTPTVWSSPPASSTCTPTTTRRSCGIRRPRRRRFTASPR